MDYLRDDGASIGCYFNRYLTRVDLAEEPLEQSFGLSAWRSLEHLERWVESHPTHLKIYGSLMGMKRALNRTFHLRLYHEVSVVKADEQRFEYVNCHPQTGFLKATQTSKAQSNERLLFHVDELARLDRVPRSPEVRPPIGR